MRHTEAQPRSAVLAREVRAAAGAARTDRVAPHRRALTGRAHLAILAVSTGLLATGAVAVHAHGFRVGAIEIEHPYATPTPPGARTAAVYFRALQNRGERADRLVAASAPIAQGVEIHRGAIDAQGVMRMRAIDSIELPAGAKVRVPRGGPVHLMLTGLRSPLADGDRFPITLRFEHAGEREVTVWVQRPRSSEREHRH